MKDAFIFLSLFVSIYSIKLQLLNNCSEKILVVFEDANKKFEHFYLNGSQTKNKTEGHYWSGSIFARTRCTTDLKNTSCETGPCLKGMNCSDHLQVIKPYTKAEFLPAGKTETSTDIYAVTLDNGYNIDISIEPIDGTFSNVSKKDNWCKKISGCKPNTLNYCPEQLRKNDNLNMTVGCHTSCTRDELNSGRCCDGDGKNCNKLRQNFSGSSQFYKENCPDYVVYDDNSENNVFFCKGSNGGSADYLIKFC